MSKVWFDSYNKLVDEEIIWCIGDHAPIFALCMQPRLLMRFLWSYVEILSFGYENNQVRTTWNANLEIEKWSFNGMWGTMNM